MSSQIAPANTASWGNKCARAAFGLNNRVTATRGGLRWDLELSEGIDKVIYPPDKSLPMDPSKLRRMIPDGVTSDVVAKRA